MESIGRSEFTEPPGSATYTVRADHDDADLIAEMKVRIALESWASTRGIWVDARDGTIALVGVVNSETEKAALAAMAREIDGCREVENHLLVKSELRDYGIAY